MISPDERGVSHSGAGEDGQQAKSIGLDLAAGTSPQTSDSDARSGSMVGIPYANDEIAPALVSFTAAERTPPVRAEFQQSKEALDR